MMSYFSEGLPQIDLNPDEEKFWESCNQQRLMFQRCESCGYVQHPPTPSCPKCQSEKLGVVEAPEVGEIFTYTIVHHPSHFSVKAAIPYNIIVVDYPELGHVRLISNLVGKDAPRIGDKVRLIWERQGANWLPRFEKA